MQLTKKQGLLIGLGAVLVLGAVGSYAIKNQVPAFPIAAEDKISSWSFMGANTGNETAGAQTRTDAEKLRGLLGKGQYDDYDLWVGIGNDANLLGDGKAAYDAYNRAIAIHPDTKGLAYQNVGHLMEELGAYQTAKNAYARAVVAEPGMLPFHEARLDFLTRALPNDNAEILKAVQDAYTQFGDTAEMLSIQAGWLKSLGRYQDAIDAWKRIEFLTPGKDHSAVEAEIKRLKAKL